MQSLRHLSISRKFVLVILLTCATVLVLALTALFVFQSVRIKSEFINDLEALGRIVAHNSAAAVAFDDREAALQVLSSMDSRPEIEGICLVLANGEHVMKSAHAHEQKHDTQLEGTLMDGHRIIDNDVLVASPVTLEGKRLGTLYLRVDFRPIQTRLLTLYGEILAVVLIASLLVAFGLASRLERFITAPILHLAAVVQRVGEKCDYSLRAMKAGQDEVGTLTDAFNTMLSQIQQRDAALHAAQSELENRVLDRTKELASSLAVLNATLDSTADGILAVGLGGEILCFNAKFLAMWQVPLDMLQRRDSAEMTAFAASKVVDQERFLRRIQGLSTVRETDAFDVIEMKDGRTLERYIQPQRAGGKIVGMVINFRDITERKRAEADLEKVHRQLLETSRQAGMAEVATGVLHNVGNVLNSVNISATVVTESVKKSKVGNLARIVDLLDSHASGLAAFLDHDPQGRKVPTFLRQLHGRLIDEQRIVLAESELLRQNIEHIKEIVTMQQDYAKVSGITEFLKVTELVEDGLRINAAALARDGVAVERRFEDVPAIPVEKHKVLQILVNLIGNARRACTDDERADKRLVISVTQVHDWIQIAVTDNGIGIPPANLTRIFNHGFTTRKDGHGFGLHSGALAAREMGGSLRAESKGPGEGATFTLDLPVGRPASQDGHLPCVTPKKVGHMVL